MGQNVILGVRMNTSYCQTGQGISVNVLEKEKHQFLILLESQGIFYQQIKYIMTSTLQLLVKVPCHHLHYHYQLTKAIISAAQIQMQD